MAPYWRRVVGAGPRVEAFGEAEAIEHGLEHVVDVHAFTPVQLARLAEGARFEGVRVSGEELVAGWFGWANRTLESTAEPRQIPRLWHQYAYRGYMALKALDDRVLERALPPAIFYNLLISADAVRDRVAARVKEQTGRDLTVNGSTSLLLTPSPHIVLTDVEIVDPENRAGADLKVARLAPDLSYGQMFSREVDAKRVLMERPVFTIRLKPQNGGLQQEGDAGTRVEKHATAPLRVIAAGAALAATRDIRLDEVQIEDGTVRIIYDQNGAERRIEKIEGMLL